MTTFFEDIKRYVGFDAEDAEALRGLLPAAEPYFAGIAANFYARIQRHPNANEVLEGPEQVERLKKTLVRWMRSGLEGPHDEAFHEKRKQIGRMHVRIDLPQQYMLTAMNVIRLDFRGVVEETYARNGERRRVVNDALDKLFDLELAIMLDTYREDSEQRLRRRERLATIGQVAAGIAHDLRNPLGVIESSLYLVEKRTREDERAARHVARIGEHVRICGSIIEDLLEMARTSAAQKEPVEVESLFKEAQARAQVPGEIAIERDFESGLRVPAQRGLLAQALANLMSNAASVYEGGEGTISLRARRGEDGEVLLEVADRGPGFDPEILSRIFEPLVTTRARGVGLGLALVKNIVERHHGEVQAANRPGGGAIVGMRLPGEEGGA